MDGKRISVRVVEWTSRDERTTVSTSEATVTAEGGVEAAVLAAYSVFPNNCVQVLLVRGGGVSPVRLWHTHVGAWVHSRADAYALVQDGDVVEVQKWVRVLGPDMRGPGAAYELEDDHEERDPRPPAGAVASDAGLVRGLLRRLRLAMPD